jgi:hypothetical protein
LTAAATAVINKNGMGRIGEIFKWKNKAGYLDAQTDSKGILISQIAVLTGGFAIPTAKAGGQGRVIRKILILGLGLLLAWGWPVLAAPLPTIFRLAQTETVFYPKDSIRPIAACKVAEVFVDHRRLGFFSFQLCPVLVLQGVDIRLGEAAADNGWMRELGSRLAPGLAGPDVEWREVDLATSRTNSPHLHAKSARLMEAKDPVVCRLENCVIEADGQRWHAARANWQMAGNRHELAWRTDDGQAMRWDLSTGEIFTNNQIGKN